MSEVIKHNNTNVLRIVSILMLSFFLSIILKPTYDLMMGELEDISVVENLEEEEREEKEENELEEKEFKEYFISEADMLFWRNDWDYDPLYYNPPSLDKNFKEITTPPPEVVPV